MPNKYFAIDGIATYFHHLGPTTLPEELPDLSRGEALLYLHGAGGNGSFVLPLAERLAERHSPITFDFPGHARSGANSPALIFIQTSGARGARSSSSSSRSTSR